MSFSDSEEDEGMVMLEAARYTGRAERIDHSPPKKKRKLSHTHSNSSSHSNTNTNTSSNRHRTRNRNTTNASSSSLASSTSSSSLSTPFVGRRLQPSLPPKRSLASMNPHTPSTRTSHAFPLRANSINLRQRGNTINITPLNPTASNTMHRPNLMPRTNHISLLTSDSDSDDDNEYDDDTDDFSSSSSNDIMPPSFNATPNISNIRSISTVRAHNASNNANQNANSSNAHTPPQSNKYANPRKRSRRMMSASHTNPNHNSSSTHHRNGVRFQSIPRRRENTPILRGVGGVLQYMDDSTSTSTLSSSPPYRGHAGASYSRHASPHYNYPSRHVPPPPPRQHPATSTAQHRQFRHEPASPPSRSSRSPHSPHYPHPHTLRAARSHSRSSSTSHASRRGGVAHRVHHARGRHVHHRQHNTNSPNNVSNISINNSNSNYHARHAAHYRHSSVTPEEDTDDSPNNYALDDELDVEPEPEQTRNQNHNNSASSSHRATSLSQPILPISTQPVYRFGNKQYPNPLNINPGAIVRLELVNFLCHSNFSITFHPNINIISGQNGSGKSAIEAGISMALGTSARKTTRGNTVRDVIKFNQDFAKIRLYLHNRGPEALKEYGPEICIERKLSTAGKNGTSSFKVLDSNLKVVGNGMRAVRDIAERLNIHVDNPCVVLKQEAAKQFLNSAKERDKYRFFMQASKLGDFVEVLRESMDNVDIALEQQKQTKESFGLIKQQYDECKRNYDNLLSIQSQEKLIEFYIRSEKWMKYNKKLREVNRLRNKAAAFKTKCARARNMWEKQKLLLTDSVKKATEMKKQIEADSKRMEEMKEPIGALKKDLKTLEKKRKDIVRKKASKEKLVLKAKQKVKDFKQEIQELKDSMENDERGQQLQEINSKLAEYERELTLNRQQLPGLQERSQPTIEMKEKEAELKRVQNQMESKRANVENIRNELEKLKSQKTSKVELFCPAIAQRNGVSVQQIRELIQANKHHFKRKPIGPIGEYISVKGHDVNTGNSVDKQTQDKYIGVIQAALGNMITDFLVETSSDQQLFRKLCYQKFKIVVPCIQYGFESTKYKIKPNPFSNYRLRPQDGPLLRIVDMFDIKDDDGNASWIYNTILTNTGCERAFAYGTLQSARRFLSSLSDDKLRCVDRIYTYMEQRICKVSRRGQSISGQPVMSRPPIIGADTTRLIKHYNDMLVKELSEQQQIERTMTELSSFVSDMQIKLNGFQNQLRNIKRSINKLETNISKLNSEKNELDEDNERNQSHERITELENNIHDEQLVIDQYDAEIAPYNTKIDEITQRESQRQQKVKEIEDAIQQKSDVIQERNTEFQRFLDEIKKERLNYQKIPERLRALDMDLETQVRNIATEELEMQRLREEAQQCGDQVTPDQYPCKPMHMTVQNPHYPPAHGQRVKFKLTELIIYRKRIQASIQEWRNVNNDPKEIIQRFEAIKPKYEQHQEAVRKCNNNVDAMNLILHERRREYKKMKECVTEQLNTEFRYVMRQQAHDGNLEVDFERGKLNLKVIMASHDQQEGQQHQVVNSKTLSGGEKSFTQIALIMALQKFCGTPMCIYDEFDVFMDSVNRGNSIKILLKTAIKNGGDRQYIFITPHDVSPMMDRRYRDMIRIHKLDAPRPDR